MTQRLATHTEQERTDWIQAIRLAGYDVMRAQLQYLRDQIEKRRGNRMDIDLEMHRLQTGKEIGEFCGIYVRAVALFIIFLWTRNSSFKLSFSLNFNRRSHFNF